MDLWLCCKSCISAQFPYKNNSLLEGLACFNLSNYKATSNQATAEPTRLSIWYFVCFDNSKCSWSNRRGWGGLEVQRDNYKFWQLLQCGTPGASCLDANIRMHSVALSKQTYIMSEPCGLAAHTHRPFVVPYSIIKHQLNQCVWSSHR